MSSSSLQPNDGQDDGPVAPRPRCKNCDAALIGRFCSNCGQAADVHVPTTVELVHELMEGLTHSDSRLWRTLKYLCFKPGRLTQEFVAGRRAAYLPPFRLYLVMSILFFLFASLSHPRGEGFHVQRAQGAAGSDVSRCDDINFGTFEQYPDLNQRIRHICKETIRDNGDNLMHVALGTMSKAMFIFLPLVAFLHMLMYWRPRYRFAEHLLFFVHLHALYFLAAIVMLAAINSAHAWPKLHGAADFLETLLGWLVLIYTVIAVRRVFSKSWVGAFVKTAALSFVYLTVFALTVAGVFVYALLQL
ncbi:MAG: DUF3667 domain-containing protein [Steroidobacteraceae bacterium]|jgi:hypothetical protein